MKIDKVYSVHPEEGDPCPNRGPDCPYGKLTIPLSGCYCNVGNAPCGHCEAGTLECLGCGTLYRR